MALTPADRDRLETTLTRGIQTLLDRAEGSTETVLTPLANRLKTAGVHVTQLRIVVGEPKQKPTTDLDPIFAKMDRENEILRQNRDLINELTPHATWENFVFLCSKKVDVTGRWRLRTAEVLDIRDWTLTYYQGVGKVPAEWMAKVAALPDWITAPRQQSNFSQIAGELVRRLRHSGMSRREIAKAFNDFIRDFNGTHVSAADITRSLD